MVDRPSLLIVCQRSPISGHKGDQLIIRNRLPYLSKVYKNVYFLICGNPFVYRLYVSHDSSYSLLFEKRMYVLTIFRILCNFISGFSLQRAFYNSSIILKFTLKFLPECQVLSDLNVLFLTSRVVPSIHFLRSLSNLFPNIKYSVDFIDSLSLNFSRRQSRGLARYLNTFESRRLKLDEVTMKESMASSVVSPVDHSHILSLHKQSVKLSSDKPFLVIPNGVTSRNYCTYPRIGLPLRSNHFCYIGFLGNLDYNPNFTAVKCLLDSILPAINLPICLFIAGPARVANIPRLISEANLGPHSVIYQGFVNDRFNFFDQLDFFVAPMMNGSGMQNKVLEACSYGIPTVCTPLAADPLSDIKGLFVSTHSSSASFASKLTDVIALKKPIVYASSDHSQSTSRGYNWYKSAMQMHSLFE